MVTTSLHFISDNHPYIKFYHTLFSRVFSKGDIYYQSKQGAFFPGCAFPDNLYYSLSGKSHHQSDITFIIAKQGSESCQNKAFFRLL